MKAPRAASLWGSTIGKKVVMAVTGLLMVAFLVLHMLGNLKIFFGPQDFNEYARWLRTIGEPVLHASWFLWAQRVTLTAALALHVTAAAQLSRRDRAARPERYRHGSGSRWLRRWGSAQGLRWQATYATRTMRYGGVIIGLFLIWHVLDLSIGVAHPSDRPGQPYQPGLPYQNVTQDFQVWWINVIYIVAIVLVGMHIQHGFGSAAQSLGVRRAAQVRVAGTALAIFVTAGFIAVPVGVMTGLVR